MSVTVVEDFYEHEWQEDDSLSLPVDWDPERCDACADPKDVLS